MSASLYHIDERPQNYRVRIMQLGSGWAAVMVVDIHDAQTGAFLYHDVEQTGTGRYATCAEALPEAQAWAKAEGLPLADER